MSRDLFAALLDLDNRDAAAGVKARLGLDEVLEAFEMVSDEGGDTRYECPFCRGFSLEPHKDNMNFTCGSCAETGDIITLVRAHRYVVLTGAIKLLEELIGGSGRDTKTGDLF